MDHAVLEDVGAQTSAMHQRTEDRTPGVTVYDGAGLAQPRTPAADRAYLELAADEGIEVDSAGDDVAAVLVRS